MGKTAISVTLRAENLLWLRGQTRATARRSVSETLDELIAAARTGAGGRAVVRATAPRTPAPIEIPSTR